MDMWVKREGLMVFLAVLPLVLTCVIFLNFLYFAPDEYVYMNNAHKFLYSPEGVDYIRFPLFPVLLAVPFAIAASQVTAKLFVMVAGMLCLLALYSYSKKILGKEKAFYATLIASTSPLFLFVATRIFTEIFFMLFFIMALFFMHVSKKKQKYLLLAGVFSGLMFLTRYLGGYVIFILILWVFFNRKVYRLWSVLGYLAAFLGVVAPFFALSYVHTGDPLPPLTFLQAHYMIPIEALRVPDRIPDYLILPHSMAAFSILGLSSVLLWHLIYKKRGKILHSLQRLFSLSRKGGRFLDGKFLLVVMAVVVGLIVTDIISLPTVKLLRYVIPFVPFLAVLAAAGMEGKKIKKVVAVVCIANLALSMGFIYYFYTGYTRHVDYSVAGNYIETNCQAVHSNVNFLVYNYMWKEGVGVEDADCILFSEHDSAQGLNVPEGYLRMNVDGLSDKMQVYRKL